jgi:uncharacterized protein YecE (DUF72 family)
MLVVINMDFGHIEDPKAVDRILKSLPLTLPENDARVALTRKKKVQIYIGPPVWSHPGWKGSVYPKKTASTDFLKFFSRQFNAIELNSTFYRAPDAKTLKQWKDSTPSTFRFSPKLSQNISHAGASNMGGKPLRDFCKQMEILDDRLGLSFLQLPPSFGRNQLPSLKSLLSHVPKDYPLAVEFRHPSWFQTGRLVPEISDFLAEHHLSTVITDTLGRRDVLHSTLTSSRVMVRFLANEMHPSDYKRLDGWVKKIGTWIELGAQEIYFYPHLHGYDRVPELSSYLIQKLNQAYELDIKDWTPAEEEQPRLF